MSWDKNHRVSESLVAAAYDLYESGDIDLAKENYLIAAKYEEKAAQFVAKAETSRTFGITAISAISLYLRGGDFNKAHLLGKEYLSRAELPAFAKEQIEELLKILDDKQ